MCVPYGGGVVSRVLSPVQYGRQLLEHAGIDTDLEITSFSVSFGRDCWVTFLTSDGGSHAVEVDRFEVKR